MIHVMILLKDTCAYLYMYKQLWWMVQPLMIHRTPTMSCHHTSTPTYHCINMYIYIASDILLATDMCVCILSGRKQKCTSRFIYLFTIQFDQLYTKKLAPKYVLLQLYTTWNAFKRHDVHTCHFLQIVYPIITNMKIKLSMFKSINQFVFICQNGIIWFVIKHIF